MRSEYLSMAAMLKPISIAQRPNALSGKQSVKILAVDSYGLPIEFTVTGGDIYDRTAASKLIEILPPTTAIAADKGYDSGKNREQIKSKGADAVIPRMSN